MSQSLLGPHPGIVIEFADDRVVIPAFAADAKKELQGAAHLDGGVASVAGVGGQRQAVGTGTDDGHIIRCSVHLLFHGGQGIKPAGVACVGPARSLHGLHDAQVGKLR